MIILDYFGILKKSVARVESIDNPYGDYYTVKMKLAADVNWTPGEHAIFTLPQKEIEGKKWRPFSVASAPVDGYLMIGTRTGKEMSNFKQALLSLEPGDPVTVRGPFGWFKLQDETSPLVFVAGGVGITPIWAILKYLEGDTDRIRTLIYTARDYHLFGEEIEEMAKDNPAFDLYMTSSSKEAKAKVEEVAGRLGAEAHYFVSGAPKFIKSVREQIMAHGVSSKKVIFDPFIGF